MIFKPFIWFFKDKVIKIADFNMSVLWGVLFKFWGALSGPITILLISAYFSPELQGYYYTFAALLGWQVLVELGLNQVIIQFVSHERAHISFHNKAAIEGDPLALQRLTEIGHMVFRWYFLISMLFVAVLIFFGEFFFNSKFANGISWQAPWIVFCILAGFNLFLSPALAMVEGFNKVAEIFRFRFFQAIMSSLLIWGSIVIGAELWAHVYSLMASIVGTFIFLVFGNREILRVFLKNRETYHLGWFKDLWPMQWRIAVSWISGFFCFSLFVPLLFKYQGPVVAGQMGMTWALLSVAMSMASVWIHVQVPTFGTLISQKRYMELDQLFFRSFKKVMFFSFLLLLMILLAMMVLSNQGIYFMSRLLPFHVTMFFGLGLFGLQISSCLAIYLRAHKKEPFMLLSLIHGIFIMTTTYFGSKYWGPYEVAIGFFSVVFLLLFPAIYTWFYLRKLWHQNIAYV